MISLSGPGAKRTYRNLFTVGWLLGCLLFFVGFVVALFGVARMILDTPPGRIVFTVLGAGIALLGVILMTDPKNWEKTGI